MSTPLPLTRGRRTALAIGVPVSLALIAWGAFNVIALLSADSFQIHQSVAAAGGQVSVSVDTGNLSLEPAAGDQVALTGVAHYGLVRPTVDVTSSGAGVSITAHCAPDQSSSLPSTVGAEDEIATRRVSAPCSRWRAASRSAPHADAFARSAAPS